MAYGILVPQPGIDLASPAVEVLDHKGSPQNLQIWIKAIKGQTKTYSIRRLVTTEGGGNGGVLRVCLCVRVGAWVIVYFLSVSFHDSWIMTELNEMATYTNIQSYCVRCLSSRLRENQVLIECGWRRNELLWLGFFSSDFVLLSSQIRWSENVSVGIFSLIVLGRVVTPQCITGCHFRSWLSCFKFLLGGRRHFHANTGLVR